MKYITILCDFKYIHYAVALIQSLPTSNLYVINFLCLDDKTYNTISKFEDVKCYREDIFVNNKAILNLKQKNCLQKSCGGQWGEILNI